MKIPFKKKQHEHKEKIHIPTVKTWPYLILEYGAVDSFIQSQFSLCRVGELRTIAKRHGIRLKGTKKANIIEQLRKEFVNRTHRPDVLQGLTQKEFQVFQLLYTVYGIRPTLLWEEAMEAWGQLNPGGTEKELREALNGLFTYGFLYPCNLHQGAEEHFHWLPTLRLLRLPVLKWTAKTYAPAKKRRLSQLAKTPPVPIAIWMLVSFIERESVYLRERLKRHPRANYFSWIGDWEHDSKDIVRVLQQGYSFSYGHKNVSIPIVIPAHEISETVLQKLSRWLGTDRDFADWLVLLAVSQQLLHLPKKAGGKLILDSSSWDSWTTHLPDSQLHQLFNNWLYSMKGFTELALVKKLNPNLRIERDIFYEDFAPADLILQLEQTRHFVVRLLQDLPASQWLNWDAFVDRAYQINPQFLTVDWPFEVWGFREQHSKQRLDPSKRKDWNKAYQPVLAAILEGPLRWLGIVEVVYRGNKLVAFRLTETGTWLLRGEGTPKIIPAGKEGGPPVVWRNKDVFHVRISSEVLDFLKVASKVAAPTNRPYTYRLTDKNIEQTFKEGMNPSVIIKTFAEIGAPIPEDTRRRLESTWLRFGQLHLYENLTVIELADDMALREILASTNLQDHVIYQFSPRLVVVKDQVVDQLLDTLVKKGYTPKLVEKSR